MRKKKTVNQYFREGRLAFQNEIAVSDNPYKNDTSRAEARESGWKDAEKTFEDSKTKQDKKSEIEVGSRWLGGLVAIGLVVAVGMAFFGDGLRRART